MVLNNIIIAPKAKFVLGRIQTDWDDVPTVGVSLFCGHGVHSELPVTSLYVLIGHKVQAPFANPAANDPFGHASHEFPLPKNVPAGHGANEGADDGTIAGIIITYPSPGWVPCKLFSIVPFGVQYEDPPPPPPIIVL